jgi:hypothetical protein
MAGKDHQKHETADADCPYKLEPAESAKDEQLSSGFAVNQSPNMYTSSLIYQIQQIGPDKEH